MILTNTALHVTIFQLKRKPDDTLSQGKLQRRKFLVVKYWGAFQMLAQCFLQDFKETRAPYFSSFSAGKRHVTLLSQQSHKPNVAVPRHHSRCPGQKKKILFKLKAFLCSSRKQVEESLCDVKELFMHMRCLGDAIKPEHGKTDWLGLAPERFKGQKPWISAGFSGDFNGVSQNFRFFFFSF